jgi:hypothetical protein
LKARIAFGHSSSVGGFESPAKSTTFRKCASSSSHEWLHEGHAGIVMRCTRDAAFDPG